MLRIWLIVLVAARASARDSDKRRLLPPEAELREAQAQCTAQQELAPLDHWARRKRLWAFSGRCPQLCEPTPTPISLEFMRAQLAPFAAAYRARPRAVNFRGMSMSHAFSLWCVIRWLRPPAIVESGVFKAFGTYIIRQAAGPRAKILSIDPRDVSIEAFHDPNPRTLRFRGADFVDLGSFEWSRWLPNASERAASLVVLDDHMNALKRMLQLSRAGFAHLWYEDEGQGGSYRHSCEPLADAQPVYVDNFRTLRLNISAVEDRANLAALAALTKAFHLTPPIFNPCTDRHEHAAHEHELRGGHHVASHVEVV